MIEVYKHCSPISFPEESCYEFDVNNSDGTQHIDVCKSSCKENDCNDKTLHAESNHFRNFLHDFSTRRVTFVKIEKDVLNAQWP